MLDYEASIKSELAELDAADARGTAATKTVELDQQSVGRLSRMDALQSQAMAQSQAARRAARRAALNQALRSLADGTFGQCADCEEEIEAKRLTFDLTVRLCLDCQKG
ncbi:MAG: TraR/DksA C4-type zinc finger protein [Pseudomonadota bacterium]